MKNLYYKITINEKLRHYISIIVWIAFFIIFGLTFYVNRYLPHGPMYTTGEIVCRNDDRGPCGEEYKEDMRGLNISNWAKFFREDGFHLMFILALIGIVISTKNKEQYE